MLAPARAFAPLRRLRAPSSSSLTARTTPTLPSRTRAQRLAYAKPKGKAAEEAAAAAAAAAAAGVGSKRPRPDAAGDESGGEGGAGAAEPQAKREAGGDDDAAAAAAAAPAPNKILLASGLPAEATEPMIVALFGRFPGLKDVRLIAERGLAFVEYSEHAQSAAAQAALNGFALTAASSMAVAFAKK